VLLLAVLLVPLALALAARRRLRARPSPLHFKSKLNQLDRFRRKPHIANPNSRPRNGAEKNESLRSVSRSLACAK
jgi:hypothetical protein